jgi:eukaryotic-like serine/threonine-protein kinase
MPIRTGSRLGVYEVIAPLGAGGMGEVYRARDTRLKRDVALKILPESFSSEPDRLARFQREAEVLASLNHPNIAQIFGLEDGVDASGRSVQAIAMELVDGPTLADRIARDGCHSTKRSPSPGRSPMRSSRRTTEPSSTAISSRRTSS